MVSPFRSFRKRQKAMLAVLALLSMVAFVVLPIWMDTMSTYGSRNPVVVSTTRYGDIDQMHLSALLQRRQTLRGFMRQIGQAVAMTRSDPYSAQFLAAQIENFFGPIDEKDVVETWVLARRAEEIGLVISDVVVNDFLRNITTEQGITGEQVKQILSAMKLSQNQLFDLLKQELLAQKLEQIFLHSLSGVTPAERWDCFQRLNRRVTAEVVPVEVSALVDKVADPDEATLAAFFEKYKEKPFVPGSPEPGFLVPEKIALEYFKADFERLTEIVEVSDAEVQAYYEENKEQLYRREKLPEMPDETPAEEQPETEAPPSAAPAETPAPSEPQPDATEEPAADEPETEAPPSAAPAETPTPSEPQPDAMEEPAADEPETDAPPEESSSATWPRRLHLAALERTAESEDAELPAPAGEGPTLSAANEDLPSQPPAAEPDKPAAEPDASAAEPAQPTAESEKPADEPTAAAAAEEEPPEYVPLSEVVDEIRRRLAQQRIQEVLGRLRDKMAGYHDDWIVYESLPEEEKGQKSPPEKLDVAALAEENRLSAHRTELVSAFELKELDIGKSSVDRGVPFVSYVFETLPEYRPGMSQDDDGNYYLFWKIGQSDESVPDWSNLQVRGDVLRAWKIVHARELAKAEAERLAGEARKSGKSLGELFGERLDLEVLVTNSFSWLTYGSIPPSLARTPPRISEVTAWSTDPETGKLTEREAVQVPGDEFMRVVTRLSAGEIAVAMNAPQTAAYAVRVTAVDPAPYQLYDRFVQAPVADYVMVVRADYDEAIEAWRSGIQGSIGLEWQRDPNRSR